MESVQISELLKDLFQLKTFGFFAVVAFFGLLGGLARLFVTPKEERKSLWGYIVVGSASAIAILLVITPKDAVMLVALSIAAGYAGKTVLDNLGISNRLAAANKKLEEEEDKKEKNMNELKNLKETISAAINNIDRLELPEQLAKSVSKSKAKDSSKAFSELESLYAKPAIIQNELFQAIGKIDAMENSLRTDLKKAHVRQELFVIILDEDYNGDERQYKVVYETNNLKDAQSKNQYTGIIKHYPRDAYDVIILDSLTLEHTETGAEKPGKIYKLF